MSEDLIKKDQRYIWHPFAQAKKAHQPILMKSGKGIYLYDADGKEYLDMISSWWVNLHGHSHPKIVKALHEQASSLEHVMFSNFTHEPAINLSEQLLNKLGEPFSRVFFSDNGSTAVEVALKLAYQYWVNLGNRERTDFIAFKGGYHGDTFGAMAVGRMTGYFRQFHSLLFKVNFIDAVDTWIGRQDQVEAEQQAILKLDKLLEERGKNTAAIIVEPLILGAGGMRFYRPEYLEEVIKRCRACGILVIFDEVMTGFGRTGKMFAFEHIEAKPDLICLSKGLTAGFLPMSITAVTSQIWDAFYDDHFIKGFAHGHSFTANPLGCAVALASLKVFEADNVLSKLGTINDWYRELIPTIQSHSGIEKIRIQGTVLAFDMKKRIKNLESPVSKLMQQTLFKHGLILEPLGRTIYLMPPYCVEKSHIQKTLDTVLNVLS
jgi:adenosylmethionine-8-amino-7-oxononanoate aminotransferase